MPRSRKHYVRKFQVMFTEEQAEAIEKVQRESDNWPAAEVIREATAAGLKTVSARIRQRRKRARADAAA